jgi:hypothetical protein
VSALEGGAAGALLAEAEAAGLRLWVDAGKVQAAALAEPPAALLARLRARRAELLTLLSGETCRHCGKPAAAVAGPERAAACDDHPPPMAFADGTVAHPDCHEAARAVPKPHVPNPAARCLYCGGPVRPPTRAALDLADGTSAHLDCYVAADPEVVAANAEARRRLAACRRFSPLLHRISPPWLRPPEERTAEAAAARAAASARVEADEVERRVLARVEAVLRAASMREEVSDDALHAGNGAARRATRPRHVSGTHVCGA